MPKVGFTAPWVKSSNIIPESGQVDYFDTGTRTKGRSFGLRVSAGGRKTWFVMYRANGRQRRLCIGTYPDMDLKEARTEAEREVGKIADNRDRAAEKAEARKGATFEEIAKRYIEDYAKPSKRSWKRDKEILDRDVLPKWRNRKACEIRRADVKELLSDIAGRGAGVAANRTLAVIRKLFNWAIYEEDTLRREHDLLVNVEANPCLNVKRPAPEGTRDRVLRYAEIKELWESLDQGEDKSITEPVRLALKLVLVTAQRKGEVINAEKGEFDLDHGWWTIPANHTKNKQAHRVPLTALAVQLIKRAWGLSGDSPFLFPSPRGGKPILATAVDQAVRKNRKALKIPHWTPHDLRRTAASHMASEGVPRFVIGRVLNHAETGVTAVYDRHSYDQEKRQALETWEKVLRDVLTDKEPGEGMTNAAS